MVESGEYREKVESGEYRKIVESGRVLGEGRIHATTEKLSGRVPKNGRI